MIDFGSTASILRGLAANRLTCVVVVARTAISSTAALRLAGNLQADDSGFAVWVGKAFCGQSAGRKMLGEECSMSIADKQQGKHCACIGHLDTRSMLQGELRYTGEHGAKQPYL